MNVVIAVAIPYEVITLIVTCTRTFYTFIEVFNQDVQFSYKIFMHSNSCKMCKSCFLNENFNWIPFRTSILFLVSPDSGELAEWDLILQKQQLHTFNPDNPPLLSLYRSASLSFIYDHAHLRRICTHISMHIHVSSTTPKEVQEGQKVEESKLKKFGKNFKNILKTV